ncbi:MAG: hypothetical protein GY768_12300 [Planctomycetaceae bacterium]|nr:hypothetical protein [Planctomycetaceae bacterium]
MVTWIRKLIRNKSSEKDVRDFLDGEGFVGMSAKFYELELHAIERPGWVQIYRFSVRVSDQSGRWVSLFGVIRDDQRKSRKFWLTESESERKKKATDWSKGMISLERRPLSKLQCLFLIMVATVFGFALLGAILSSL